MVGSGPFRFIADERVAGSHVVYDRFEGYVPRPDGPANFTAGPKRVYFDRVEWIDHPRPQTAAERADRAARWTGGSHRPPTCCR